MPRQAFEAQLQELLGDLWAMGQAVAEAIDTSVRALREQDEALARAVIEQDDQINAMQHAIDEKCLVLIATQQPLAHDLRTILAASNIAAEMERIGDYAEGTARLALKLVGEPFIKPLVDIPRMAELGRSMLSSALQAFARHDSQAALQIGEEDTAVDDLYNQVYRELLLIMMQDPRTITQATYLIWVAHNLERIADRTTNIAERTVFVDSGRVVDLNR
ncbi:MAG TPA: phosphate signaling complex protein PhoU [Anaerolineae bacterium]|nr:phosphate signaling complex protein PhoU [Anaerolineae bacterium]